MNSAATPTQTFTILRSHFTRIDPDDFMIVLSPEDLNAIKLPSPSWQQADHDRISQSRKGVQYNLTGGMPPQADSTT